LRAWYYPGDTIGNEFPYPKNSKLLAMANVTETSARSMTETETTVSQATAVTQPDNTVAETTVATPATESNEVKPVEETAVVAEQSNAADATPAPDSPAAQSSELPKTGSFYPLIGLGGALMLAFAGLLRLARTA
jgi:LPXTG-motif cell wall-anchored protein